MSPETNPPSAVIPAAADACTFGYPLVLMERMRLVASAVPAPRAATMQAPHNRLVHAPLDGRGTDVLRSAAWLDVGPEPVLLFVPETRGRYSVVSLRDMWTEVFAVVGPRTTGSAAGAYVICGPGYRGAALPAGVTPISSPTRFVALTLLLYADGARDVAAAAAAQARFELRPLSGARVSPSPSRSGPPIGASARAIAIEQVDQMDGREFFFELGRLLELHPPPAAQRPVLDVARRLGLLAGAAGWERLGEERRVAACVGLARGLARVRAHAASLRVETAGHWLVRGAVGRYGGDYSGRAGAAYAGLSDTPAADELHALARADAAGCALSGSHRYVLRFPPDALPPALASWSLSACSCPGHACAGSLGSHDGLALDRRGSLGVHMQRDAPTAYPRTPNWLRTPAGAFELGLRLVWPTTEAVDGSWAPPPIVRIG